MCGRIFVLNPDGTARYFKSAFHTWSGNGIVEPIDMNCPDHRTESHVGDDPFPYTEPT